MAQPEKDPENKPETKQEKPRLDAILPDDTAPSAAELVGDIDSYQKKMEKEWESAKTHYEDKINRIMEEFMVARDVKESKNSRQGDERLKNMMGELEAELRRADPIIDRLPRFAIKPEVMQLGWARAVRIPFKKWLPWACGAAVLLGVIFLYNAYAIRVTPLPYAHTLGPVVHDGRIYILDWFRKALYAHGNKAGFPILSVENVPNSFATGMAMSDKTLWSLDGLDLKINLHTMTSDHQVTASIDTQGPKPAGLFYDGLDLWSADQEAKRLYRHRGNDVEEIRDTFLLPDTLVVTAFGFFNNRLWVLDGKARLMNVYRLQKPLLPLASFDLDPFMEGATPTGFTMVGRKIWLVTENPVTLMRIPIFRLKRSKTETF